MDETTNAVVHEKGSSAGPIIAAIVILAAIVFGALYFMGERGNDTAYNSQLDSINDQSDSDETAAIEADLNSTQVENVDAEMSSN